MVEKSDSTNEVYWLELARLKQKYARGWPFVISRLKHNCGSMPKQKYRDLLLALQNPSGTTQQIPEHYWDLEELEQKLIKMERRCTSQ